MTHARRSGGFTLIEMLLAVTIFGVVMIAIYQSFDQGFRAYGTVQRSRDLYETARGVMDLVRTDLESAVVYEAAPNALFLGRDDEDGRNQPADTLFLYTLTHEVLDPVAAESDQVEVVYGVYTVPDTERRVLVRREDPHPDERHEEGGTAIVLAEDVVALDFRYWDGEEWTLTWDAAELGEAEAFQAGADRTDRRNRAILPLAVETTLVLADEAGAEHRFSEATVLRLARRAGAETAEQPAGGDGGGEDDDDGDGEPPRDDDGSSDGGGLRSRR